MFLSEAPDRALRLGDLAELCHQSSSRVGRTVQRLRAEGLVVREQCGQDARSFRARLEQAWRLHIVGGPPPAVRAGAVRDGPGGSGGLSR